MASCSKLFNMNDEFVEQKKKNEGEMRNAGLRFFLKIWSDPLHFIFFYIPLFTDIVRNEEKSTKKS